MDACNLNLRLIPNLHRVNLNVINVLSQNMLEPPTGCAATFFPTDLCVKLIVIITRGTTTNMN